MQLDIGELVFLAKSKIQSGMFRSMKPGFKKVDSTERLL